MPGALANHLLHHPSPATNGLSAQAWGHLAEPLEALANIPVNPHWLCHCSTLHDCALHSDTFPWPLQEVMLVRTVPPVQLLAQATRMAGRGRWMMKKAVHARGASHGQQRRHYWSALRAGKPHRQATEPDPVQTLSHSETHTGQVASLQRELHRLPANHPSSLQAKRSQARKCEHLRFPTVDARSASLGVQQNTCASSETHLLPCSYKEWLAVEV
mmetsp:Transcript_8827/g.16861  ORF Transcript_8827/g.16861 Transcript_8827/m.16861 type:complete len:215 (+) Transcript_8827:1477-2121(+)